MHLKIDTVALVDTQIGRNVLNQIVALPLGNELCGVNAFSRQADISHIHRPSPHVEALFVLVGNGDQVFVLLERVPRFLNGAFILLHDQCNIDFLNVLVNRTRLCIDALRLQIIDNIDGWRKVFFVCFSKLILKNKEMLHALIGLFAVAFQFINIFE
jgi:hypothetical protein